MPVFESECSWGLAGERSSTGVFLERLKGPLLFYVVKSEEKAYDFFVSVCRCRCQGGEAGESNLGRCGDTFCEEVFYDLEMASYYGLDQKGMAAVVMLTTFGHHFDRREDAKKVMNGIETFAEVDRLINAVRYNRGVGICLGVV